MKNPWILKENTVSLVKEIRDVFMEKVLFEVYP